MDDENFGYSIFNQSLYSPIARPRQPSADSSGTPRTSQFRWVVFQPGRCSTNRELGVLMTSSEPARPCCAEVGDVSTTTLASSPAAWTLPQVQRKRTLGPTTWVGGTGCPTNPQGGSRLLCEISFLHRRGCVACCPCGSRFQRRQAAVHRQLELHHLAARTMEERAGGRICRKPEQRPGQQRRRRQQLNLVPARGDADCI